MEKSVSLFIYLSEIKTCLQDCWIPQVLTQLSKLVVVPGPWKDWDKITIMITECNYAQKERKKVVPQIWAKKDYTDVAAHKCLGYQALWPSDVGN